MTTNNISNITITNKVSLKIEALNSMYITNAIYLSSWEEKRITLPKQGSEDEIEFEKAFEERLGAK